MADMINIELFAKTMDGSDAVDPEVTVDITQVLPSNQAVARNVIPDFRGSARLQIETPVAFVTWQVTVTFSRFDAGSGFFVQPRTGANFSHTFTVARLPNRWTPSFRSLAGLASPRFDAFKGVLAVSNAVDLKNGPAVGDLNTNYDSMAGLPQILAKAALLNLYAVLMDENDPIDNLPWFSYVTKIVRVDQERFLAEVKAALFENVQIIISRLSSTYAAQGFFTEPAADLPLHIPNIPTAYHSDANLVQIITLKRDYGQGNVQFTLSFLRGNGGPIHLLDCDMDEHRNIVLHSFDLLQHLESGGTSPIAMHEYIVENSAQHSANRRSNINLGYELV